MRGRQVGARARRIAVMLGLVLSIAGCGDEPAINGPVAAVLDAKGTVVLVDLEQGRVCDTVGLRSWATDIAADSDAGVFVTAQSGGVGTDADNALGVIGVDGERFVRYVSLPRPNPLGVEVVGRSMVLVDHGWMEPQGMFACLVDTARVEVTRRGYIPDNNEPVSVVGGFAWSSGVDVLTDETSLRRVDLQTLESTVVGDAHVGPGERRAVDCATGDGLFGWVRRRGAAPLLTRFDAATGTLDATAAADFEDGPGRLVSAGNLLVTVDFSGEDLAKTDGRLLVFDPRTLALQREVRLRGVPSDAAPWGERVVVANHRDQTLQVVDPVTGAIVRTVKLPKMTPLPLKVAVLE